MDDLLWLIILRLLLFIIVGSCILLFAFLEMIFAPVMIFKYMKPALIEHLYFASSTDDVQHVNNEHHLAMISLFYGVHLFVQATNFFAALALFFGIMHSEYRERWVAFDVGGLFSVALLGSLAVGQLLVASPNGSSLCAVLDRDIYTRAVLIGDANCNGKTCLRTDVFLWHQERQCCGWHSPVDAVGAGKNNNQSSMLTLPQFCCLQEPFSSEGILGSELVNNGRRAAPVVFFSFTGAAQQVCKLGSMNRFRKTCSSADAAVVQDDHVVSATSFIGLSSVSILVHPCSQLYIVLKLICSLAYAAVKKHYFVPQAEGIYADEFP